MISSCPSSGTSRLQVVPTYESRSGPTQQIPTMRLPRGPWPRDQSLPKPQIRAGHLRLYLREPTCGATASPPAIRAVADTEQALGSRQTINFILGEPVDSQYQSKKQRRRMLRAASVRARVNTVSDRRDITAVLPIDDPISFPPINPTRVITPHYDALVLTVCINSFDVHKVLIDLGNAADLLHLPAFK